MIPIGGGLWTRHVQVEGYTFRPDESEDVGFDVIAPKYFATVGTPLLTGREFDERDTNTAARVAIVNESFARYFFGAPSPLGRQVTTRQRGLRNRWRGEGRKIQDLRQDVIKTMYIPWMQREGDQPANYRYLAMVAAAIRFAWRRRSKSWYARRTRGCGWQRRRRIPPWLTAPS